MSGAKRLAAGDRVTRGREAYDAAAAEERPAASVAVVKGAATSKPHACSWPDCGAAFAVSSALTTHTRTHTGERPYKCSWPDCGAAFVTSGHLTVHARTHTGERPYACSWPDCGAAFVTSGNLTTHTRTHTGTKPYACSWPDCGAAFAASSDLTTHMRRHAGVKPYACSWPDCGAAFVTSGHLAVHARRHTGAKPYACSWPDCGAAFTESGTLTKHARTHMGTKPYTCGWPDCGAAFVASSALTVHKRMHTGEKPYKCTQCPGDTSFSQRGNLAAHTRRYHTADGAYRGVRKQGRLAAALAAAGFELAHEHRVDTSCTAAGVEPKYRKLDSLCVHAVATSAAVTFVECDEFQHKDRDLLCELARMTQVNEALALAGNTLPIVWVRWNCDAFSHDGVRQRVKVKERHRGLVRFLHALERGSVCATAVSCVAAASGVAPVAPVAPAAGGAGAAAPAAAATKHGALPPVSVWYLYYDREAWCGHVPPQLASAPEFAALRTMMYDPAPYLVASTAEEAADL